MIVFSLTQFELAPVVANEIINREQEQDNGSSQHDSSQEKIVNKFHLMSELT